MSAEASRRVPVGCLLLTGLEEQLVSRSSRPHAREMAQPSAALVKVLFGPRSHLHIWVRHIEGFIRISCLMLAPLSELTIEQGSQRQDVNRIRADLLKKSELVERAEHLDSLSGRIGTDLVRMSGPVRLNRGEHGSS